MQKGLPTSFALGKMWKLVANERWIIYAGFTSLLLAAVCALPLANPPVATLVD